MNQLVTHCEKIHNSNPQVSCICGSFLKTTNSVLVHRKKHNMKKSIKCSFCKFTFVSQVNLEKHVFKKHGENAKKFVCAVCGGSYRDSSMLKIHEKSHLPGMLLILSSSDS